MANGLCDTIFSCRSSAISKILAVQNHLSDQQRNSGKVCITNDAHRREVDRQYEIARGVVPQETVCKFVELRKGSC